MKNLGIVNYRKSKNLQKKRDMYSECLLFGLAMKIHIHHKAKHQFEQNFYGSCFWGMRGGSVM